MPAGRPRTVTPPPKEMIELGEEMLAWVEKNKPLHLTQWWSGVKFIASEIWDNMSRAPEFCPYYEAAMLLIGQQYLDKTSNVRDSISHRWLRVYFKDLRKQEDSDKDADAARAKEIQPTVDPKTGELVEALLKQISELQKKKD
jgi:hypothetical protein